MADPFDDIDGIVKAKESEVSIAQSALFNKDKDKATQPPQAEEGEAYLEQFPKRVQAKASGDLEYRLEMEQAIHSAMVELHNTREQMYVVRFDDVRSTDDIKRDLQNYMSEVERLESKINKLREKLLEYFVKSLNLEQVGVSAALITTTLHHKNSTASKNDQNRLFSEGSLAPRFGRNKSRHDLEASKPGARESEITPAEPEQHDDLLRKYSFGLLGVKNPSAGNRSPSPITLTGLNRKMSQDEMANARATLYNLRQKKELTAHEEDMVEILTTKLRANDI